MVLRCKPLLVIFYLLVAFTLPLMLAGRVTADREPRIRLTKHARQVLNRYCRENRLMYVEEKALGAYQYRFVKDPLGEGSFDFRE